MLNQIPFQLDLLRKAENYQKWSLDSVRPFLGEKILEIGSGIGNMSRWLPLREKLYFSEIDLNLIPHLEKTVQEHFLKSKKNNNKIKIFSGVLNNGQKETLINNNIDTIISFNVVEHIKDDKQFFADMLNLLRKSKTSLPKRLITFVPAHKFAYGSVDAAYGHYRRYSHNRFKKIKKELASDSKLFYRYFNFIGLPGWFCLGKILKKKEVRESDILLFEKICPIIKRFDDFLHLKLKLPLGQSILSVFTL